MLLMPAFCTSSPKSVLFLCWIFWLERLAVDGLPFSATNVAKFFPTEPWKLPEQAAPGPKFGKLKLCPPGGRSFLEAFQLACPMRRKRSAESSPQPNAIEQDPFYRPANILEVTQICCSTGCELIDLFPYCGPFGLWK
ncbi:hypothetical protein M3Y99_01351200 [Aphelenchoides fujianensis]|nr:hypothetical protein M3Y99_01351200 [Aphelenchoides fujianensis]